MKMKKITLLTLILLCFHTINAQNNPPSEIGLLVLGGSMNFSIQNSNSGSSDENTRTNFNLSPYVGKQLNDMLLLGVQLDYGYSIFKADDTFVFGQPNTVDRKATFNRFGIGVFSRHTLNPGSKFNFYLQPYFNYSFDKEKEIWDSDTVSETNRNGINVGLGLGVLYDINDRLRVLIRTGGMNYNYAKNKIVDTDIENKSSSFGTNLNLSNIFFGVELKL